MFKKGLTEDQIVKKLNRYLEIDPVGINSLFNTRVLCNYQLSLEQGPNAGIFMMEGVGAIGYQIGMVGILNMLFGYDKKRTNKICVFLFNGRITKFGKVSDKKLKQIIKRYNE